MKLSQHWVKSLSILIFPGPYFPTFGLSTERYGVSLRIQFECGNILTRKTRNTDTCHAAQLIDIIMGQKIKNYLNNLKHWVLNS